MSFNTQHLTRQVGGAIFIFIIFFDFGFTTFDVSASPPLGYA
jgi:hypothetical protein